MLLTNDIPSPQQRLEIVTTASQFAFTADVHAIPWPATGYNPALEAVEALAAMLRCCRANSITFMAPAVSYKACSWRPVPRNDMCAVEPQATGKLSGSSCSAHMLVHYGCNR